MDIQQSANGEVRELALFAGAGGGILGGKLLGWRTVCAVEREAHPAQVLAQRQNDGILEPFPIWSDVSTFDGRPWRGCVDVVSGGFPCQDISSAGKGAGIEGERSGMWKHMARIIGEVRPRFAYMENSPLLVGRGLALVIGDLAEMGYDACWGIMGAADVGAPHQRDRIWILAYPTELQRNGGQNNRKNSETSSQQFGSSDCERKVPNASSERQQGQRWPINAMYSAKERKGKTNNAVSNCGWSIEPELGRVANGLANGMDRLKAIGNGQVPRVAAEAFLRLMGIADRNMMN